jgi:hypothetical protein
MVAQRSAGFVLKSVSTLRNLPECLFRGRKFTDWLHERPSVSSNPQNAIDRIDQSRSRREKHWEYRHRHTPGRVQGRLAFG